MSFLLLWVYPQLSITKYKFSKNSAKSSCFPLSFIFWPKKWETKSLTKVAILICKNTGYRGTKGRSKEFDVDDQL